MPSAAIPVRPASPPATAVRRTAFYLESGQESLFAWLHCPDRPTHAGHGVVLCPPLGHEQVHAHRSLRHLADACARAGYPTLRLDYHGTGDSAGSDEDPDRWATWLRNVRDAQTWMRRHLSCERLSLIGVRLGAALAALAAESVEILILWAPVVKGRSYVREMKALSLAAGGAPAATGDLEPAGFVLTEQTAQDLGRLDLLQCRPSCRRVLILARDDMAADTRLLEHLQALGIDAEQCPAAGYADMMAEPHYTRVPHEAIARAVDWLGTPEGSDRPIPSAEDWPTQALLAPKLRESAVRIGRQELFGIVSESAVPASASLPFIILVNAGSAYRVGPNRLYVSLARHLAGCGFRCLRLDLGGLGDSPSADPERENDPYPATAFRDVDLAISHLDAERVVLMGLCSGAYVAFQSAARLPSPALVEALPINPLTFCWRDGMSLEASPAERLKHFRERITAALQPRKWLKLLSGRSKLGIV